MIHFEDYQIVNHFNQIWRGISSYYSFADNFGTLGRIHLILKYSCVLTLASKFKLISAKKICIKYGKDLEIKDSNGKIIASFPSSARRTPKS